MILTIVCTLMCLQHKSFDDTGSLEIDLCSQQQRLSANFKFCRFAPILQTRTFDTVVSAKLIFTRSCHVISTIDTDFLVREKTSGLVCSGESRHEPSVVRSDSGFDAVTEVMSVRAYACVYRHREGTLPKFLWAFVGAGVQVPQSGVWCYFVASVFALVYTIRLLLHRAGILNEVHSSSSSGLPSSKSLLVLGKVLFLVCDHSG